MSSLIDAFNNFIKSLQPKEVGQLNLRSCLGCSFHKVFKNDHFCCQVQPPSKILNPYDAQLCIYYTPETATTGQMTKAERGTQSSKLDFIERIGRIDDVETKLSPIKNSAFLADFTGWVNLAPAQVTIEDDNILLFLKRVRLYMNCPSLTQFLWADTNKYDKLCFWAFKPAVGGINIEAEIHFSDGTFITEAKVLTNLWHEYSISLPANKIVSQIGFYDLGGICYLVLPQLVETPNVFQPTRTNFLNKPEREDLLLKDMDFTYNVAMQEYLAVVEGQKHKIYAFGYEADTDAVCLFSATVNGSAFSFGKRITKGVYAQTLVHPIVCDVNTALNFMCRVTNAKTWIQYKTEA